MLIRMSYWLEDSVRIIHWISLQYYICFKDRLNSRHIMKNNAWITIVRATMESVIHTFKTLKIFVLSFEFSLALCRSKKLHIFCQVPEMTRGCTSSHSCGREVRHLIIFCKCKYPREHWILWQVVVTSPSKLIQSHEVFKVWDFIVDPILSEITLL